MRTAALLATGESMSHAVVDSVRDRCLVVAINDTFQLAPWADALVAQDVEWWKQHPEAHEFAARKFSTNRIEGVQQIESPFIRKSSSSGLLAMEVALRMGANRLLLLGFDMRGSHYFGPHQNGLRNTSPGRFEIFKTKMQEWAKAHPRVEIVNCTPGSALAAFRMSTIEEAL